MSHARHRIVNEDLETISSALDFESLRGASILVAGANGFLPTYMVETLLYLNETKRLGIRVVALVRNPAKAMNRFAHHYGREDLAIESQALTSKLSIAGPITHVIHAASQASPKFYNTDPAGTLAPNVVGTFNLLELAREKGAQFFFFSSSEVYGNSTDAANLSEKSSGVTDQMLVRSCYAESKRMGETMCVAWAHQHKIPVKIVRPFHTYGPGMAMDDGRVFADFVADIVSGRNIVMKSDGTAVRAYCYLADATRAFFTVLMKGAPSEAYNVGNSSAKISVVDLADKLVSLFPERKLRVERMAQSANYMPSTLNVLAPNTAKLESLGWKATTGIEEGFRRTIGSYL